MIGRKDLGLISGHYNHRISNSVNILILHCLILGSFALKIAQFALGFSMIALDHLGQGQWNSMSSSSEEVVRQTWLFHGLKGLQMSSREQSSEPLAIFAFT